MQTSLNFDSTLKAFRKPKAPDLFVTSNYPSSIKSIYLNLIHYLLTCQDQTMTKFRSKTRGVKDIKKEIEFISRICEGCAHETKVIKVVKTMIALKSKVCG